MSAKSYRPTRLRRCVVAEFPSATSCFPVNGDDFRQAQNDVLYFCAFWILRTKLNLTASNLNGTPFQGVGLVTGEMIQQRSQALPSLWRTSKPIAGPAYSKQSR
jgi:hypothetical protein